MVSLVRKNIALPANRRNNSITAFNLAGLITDTVTDDFCGQGLELDFDLSPSLILSAV